MEQIVIIRDLLDWIDKNLDNLSNRLSLDQVAEKAGYSKWHLQRMFKDVTGNAIGAYIRARRLSKSAMALRFTSRPILDIALQYRFDSQQTFTRAFKKQFNVTPALYRRAEDWSAYGMRPPLRVDGDDTLPAHEFVTLPPMVLVGIRESYTCAFPQLSQQRFAMRRQFWQHFLSSIASLPSQLYGLHEAYPSQDKEDEQEVFYATALTKQAAETCLRGVEGVQSFNLKGGDYVKFVYDGPRDGLQDFILTLYMSCMASLNLVRRKSQDIEIFHMKDNDDPESLKTLHCEYFVPIRRDKSTTG